MVCVGVCVKRGGVCGEGVRVCVGEGDSGREGECVRKGEAARESMSVCE